MWCTLQKPKNERVVLYEKCIFELANGLSNNVKDLPLDVALVTCLNLAVCEQWDTHTSSGIAHLKGAKSMIQQILELLKEQQQFIKQRNLKTLTLYLQLTRIKNC